MAVNLSPIWGAGAQLLDNSGNVLTGGKIYTYLAGTTTPATTYTSSNGNTANSNPIILNSAGRVPYEIWLTDSIEYKFVLKDSNDTLIGTWDNLVGINSNFINYYGQQEIQTATAGQTVFTLTEFEYEPGTGNLSVFVDGVNQYGPGAQYAYVETDASTVTFVSGLHVGASVKFTTTKLENPGVADASQVSYTYPDANAVAESVQDRLAQYVSVKDFGAVGDGVTDDTDAFTNAVATGKSIFIPVGNYLISATITLSKGQQFQGEGTNLSVITAPDAFNLPVLVIKQGCGVSDIAFTRPTTGELNNNGVAIQISNSVPDSWNTSIKNVSIQSYNVGINVTNYRHYIENVLFYYCNLAAVVGYDPSAPAGTTQFNNCAFLYSGQTGLTVKSTATHTQVKSSTFEFGGKHIVCDGLLYVDSCYIADFGAFLITGNGRVFVENGMVAPFVAGASNNGADYGYNFVTTDDEYCVSVENAVIKNVTMGTEWQFISGQSRRGSVMGPGKYVLENCYFKNNVADPGSPSPYYAIWPLEYNAAIPQQIMENSTNLPNYVTNGTFRNRSAVISNFTSSGLRNPWGGDIKVVPAGQTCTIAFSIPAEYTTGDPLLLMIYEGTASGGYLKVDFTASTNITANDANYQELIYYSGKLATNVYQLASGNTYGSKNNFALNSFIVQASSTSGTIAISSSGTGTGQIAAVILTPITNDPDLGRPIGWFYNP